MLIANLHRPVPAMIGSTFSPSLLHPAAAPTALRPVAHTASATAPAWLEGLGAPGASLRAEVPADQRGLSVAAHAQRVLAALVAD